MLPKEKYAALEGQPMAVGATKYDLFLLVYKEREDLRMELEAIREQLTYLINITTEIRMSLQSVQDDLAATKANLTEIEADLAEVKGLSDDLGVQVTTLQASVDDLKTKIPDPAVLAGLEATSAEIKATSRRIADVVDEPVEPPVPEPAPVP